MGRSRVGRASEHHVAIPWFSQFFLVVVYNTNRQTCLGMVRGNIWGVIIFGPLALGLAIFGFVLHPPTSRQLTLKYA